MRRGSSTVRLRRTTDAQLWDRLVDASPGATSFHRWDWLDLQEPVLGAEFERLVVHEAGTPVGVFPVPRRAGSRLRRAHVPFPYVGPLVPTHLLPAALRAFRRRQLLRGPLLARLEFPPELRDEALPALAEAGCSGRSLGTVVVDLAGLSTEEVFAHFSSSRRREVRRARRNGADVRPSTPGELAALLPALTEEAFAVHDASNPYPPETGRLVEEWARGRDDVAVLAGVADDVHVGSAVVLTGRPTALFWLGTSLREHRERHVNDLLYTAILDWAVEQECTQMDFCGSVDEGILSYKLTFGGREVDYAVGEATPLPYALVAAARRLKRRLRPGG